MKNKDPNLKKINKINSNVVELRRYWEGEEQHSFSGWDFSHLEGRWQSDSLSWDYKAIINSYLLPSNKLLDMGTGGGEFLLTLEHPYENTSVTESWEPNYLLCKERLEPLGICVNMSSEEDALPFMDNAFDIVINRHESYNISEVKRVLKPEGLFISQQVGGFNDNTLSEKLIEGYTPAIPMFTLHNEVIRFEAQDFQILFQKEEFPILKFYDIGAVVYLAKIIPWEFPEFTVDRCFQKLCKLQEELDKTGFIETLTHRFILVAKNYC